MKFEFLKINYLFERYCNIEEEKRGGREGGKEREKERERLLPYVVPLHR